ncbi:PAS domain-containing protein [Candidatus Nitrospira bockiana]
MRYPFFALADCFPEPVFLLSPTGRIEDLNRAAERQVQLMADQVRGRPLTEFLADPGGAWPHYLRLCTRSREAVPGAVTMRVGGDAMPYQANGCVFHADDPPRRFVVLRLRSKETSVSRFVMLNQRVEALTKALHRRKELEDAVREQREWFKVTLTSIGDAVIATDDQGRVTFVNPPAEALTGWTQDEAHGRPLTEVFRIINEYSRHPAGNPVERVIAEGRVVGLANHTVLIHRAGPECPIEDSAAPIRDSQGRLIGVVLVFHDITARRKAEKALEQSQQELLDRVRDLEQFHDVVVGRELKMLELEKRIKTLEAQIQGGRQDP